ncbi:TetR/AcrR family transcriptional regulator [Nocardioides bizhenqiangii]|uniref:Helix-turn-helix domain-containing protein n=1 Tax=Nocardioides bizhenqiangii TaxID=3095076 RepID=A0ABZ0ZQ72_9ACTN|nr:helix-turn-helix domain-containing protein [Nocardioides sp. HM61]WQQ26470.1 helix-turn-helix domain-containing protein [Nocardioides sp. HM61]
MSSHRHNLAETEHSPRDSYLDAARACILDVGWRRTTLTEVARRAGVSRMTIYRTWSDMQELLGDLMTREWGELLASTQPTREYDEKTGPTPTGIAEGVLRAVTVLRDNELFVRIVELDPELILPYLLARRGRSQELILGLLAADLEAGQATGTIRAGNTAALARAVVLAAHGFVLSAHTMTDDAVAPAELDEELRLLVTRFLTPEGADR